MWVELGLLIIQAILIKHNWKTSEEVLSNG